MRAAHAGSTGGPIWTRPGRHPRLVAGTLAAALLLAGIPSGIHAGEADTIAGLAQARGLLHGAIKPDWRGADSGNSGVIDVLGPASLPSQTFSTPNVGQPITGVVVDGGGNVVFATVADRVLSYAPGTGALSWSATLKQRGTSGIIGGCGSTSPVLSDDGAAYMVDDSGNLYQIAPQLRFGTDAPSGAIFADPHHKSLTLTPKIGPDNTLYLGNDAGTVYAVKPPAVDGSFTRVSAYRSFQATGSTPATGPAAGVASSSPFKLCGEAALNPAGDTVYVASSDTNPTTRRMTMGTLYALNTADLSLRWTVPLAGPVWGAVVFDAALNAVVVADAGGAITAVDGTSGSVLWQRLLANGAGFKSSPALSPNGQVIYAGLRDKRLRAYKAATGLPLPTFGNAGVATLSDGLGSAPILDRDGNLYAMLAEGTIERINPGGSIDWTLPGGHGQGTSENVRGDLTGLALGADRALLVGGMSQQVIGFNAQAGGQQPAGSPTFTPTSTSTPSPSATWTATATETPTATNTATADATATVTGTPIPTWTPSPTDTPWYGTATSTATATPGGGARPVLVVHGVVVKATTDRKLNDVVVGAFSDQVSLPADQYQAQIEWGDGLTGSGEAQAGKTPRGNRQPRAIVQLYVITGSHTYHEAGIYPIDITISAADGRVAYLTSIARVSNPES